MAATPVLKTCMACSQQATKMQKCKWCHKKYGITVYYCSSECQYEKWQQHKDTHAILAPLLAMKDAANYEQRAKHLRELWAYSRNLWNGGTISKGHRDFVFITEAHMQMLSEFVETEALQTAQERRMAIDLMAALLPFSNLTFNFAVNDALPRTHGNASLFPSLAFVLWLDGINHKMYIYTMRDVSLVDATAEQSASAAESLLVWPFEERQLDSKLGQRLGESWHGCCQCSRENDGVFYKGDWRAGKLQGHVSICFNGDDKYDGEWRNGERHGRGMLKYRNGDSYEGEWLHGQHHGKGMLKYCNGGSYEGTWRDGEPHGYGRMVYPNGDTYEGDWNAGLKHGHGKVTYAATGKSFDETEWRHGKPHNVA
jgi:hypothetical protein